MESILILFSLILHGISFVVIFMLYQKIQKKNEGERHFDKRVRETEDLFSSYLLEIKDENKKFIDAISKVDKPPHNQVNLPEQSNQSHSSESQHGNDNKELNSQSTFQPETVQVQDYVERPSIQTQIMNLYENGYTIEDIAKKLNKGNTEIELIVKFNQKMHN